MTGWLQIQAVRPIDEGTYRCLARNTLGQIEASASLTVLTPGKEHLTWDGELVLDPQACLSLRWALPVLMLPAPFGPSICRPAELHESPPEAPSTPVS